MTTPKLLFSTALLAILIASGIAVIYNKYKSRQIFIDIQKKEKELDDYEVEWGLLQLELTMLTAENRVEIEARDKLKLTLPPKDKIIYLKP